MPMSQYVPGAHDLPPLKACEEPPEEGRWARFDAVAKTIARMSVEAFLEWFHAKGYKVTVTESLGEDEPSFFRFLRREEHAKLLEEFMENAR